MAKDADDRTGSKRSISVPIDAINELLNLGLAKTFLSDEVKGWSRDDDGGTSKFYLNAIDCQNLSDAFAKLATELNEGK